VRVSIACESRLIAKTVYDSLLGQCAILAQQSDGSTPVLHLNGIVLNGTLAVHPKLEGHDTARR
jgi:hypothetical protein